MTERILMSRLTRGIRAVAPALLLLSPFVIFLGLEAARVRSIHVTVSQFVFAPARIEVGVGERVRLEIRSADVVHGFQVKALGVEAVIPAGGQPVIVELTAKEAGTFAITCSEYCGRGHGRMTAAVVATPVR